jgi:hypothetical protein
MLKKIQKERSTLITYYNAFVDYLTGDRKRSEYIPHTIQMMSELHMVANEIFHNTLSEVGQIISPTRTRPYNVHGPSVF